MSEEHRADEHDSHDGQCPVCGECGCVNCGCQAEPERSGLIHIEFGLQPFVHEPVCPKCTSRGIATVYHGCLVLNVGDKAFPCGAWYRSRILTGEIGEHLCLRCQKCGYGWPSQTADTYRAVPVEGSGDEELP